MEALLDALLEYSRAGRVAADVTEVDRAAIVHGIADSLGLADRFTISLGDLPRLTTARTPFEQVLRNLIGNAVKHHDKDSGRIAISAMQGDDAVEFSVADDGPGIPEQFRDKVFGMFQTLKPRDEVEGSGMGLALVKKIVEHYGGSVAIHAAQPRGTEVRFTWPLKIAEEGAVHGIQAHQGAAG
jgi:signal transduction histidine kinase